MRRPAAAPDRPVHDPVRGSALPDDKVPDGEISSPTTELLRRFGRRYPAVGRAAVAVLCAATAPFAAHPERTTTVVVAAGVVLWNVAYLAFVLPDGRSRGRFLVVCTVDLVLVCVLCLATPLLVDPGLQRASLGWISPIASFTVVAVQFQLPPLAAAAATLAVSLSFVAGTAVSPGLSAVDGLLVGGGWMVVEAGLARLLWRLLLRGGREADRLLRAQFAAERAAATAAARRADQRAHWAMVHDTAASTLLMIGLGEVTGTEEWLPGQVRRDIALVDGALVDGGHDDRTGEADAGAALREAADRAHVQVELDCPAEVTVPAAVASALAGAVAEALENVRRHAGTGAATLVLLAGTGVEVVIADTGRGFDPAQVGSSRLGLAWSVHDRMHAVGGRAAVESSPGRGTVVRLWWPAPSGSGVDRGRRGQGRLRSDGAAASGAGTAEPEAGEAPYLALALLRGLRIASSVIVLVILLGLVLPHLLADLALYRHEWTGMAWFAALLAVAVADAVLVSRNRSWGAARWPVAAGVLAVSVWATALLPPAALVEPAHQTLGSVGWFGVLLFADRGVGHVLGFLLGHVASTLVRLGMVGRLDAATLVDLAVVVAATGGFQVTTGAAGAALSRVAVTATDAAWRRAATVTEEAVAHQLHLDRERRYAGLRETVLPLLRGIGDGCLSPATADVRRRAALEAARLRRLFTEDGDVRDPLAAELAALVDLVERRGTDVQFSARGQRPVPPPPVCTQLVHEIGAALLAARRSARVTLSAVGAGVAVSVVADAGTVRVAPHGRRPDGTGGGGQITTVMVADEEWTWVEARWTPSAS
jgi:hypothetical protein